MCVPKRKATTVSHNGSNGKEERGQKLTRLVIRDSGAATPLNQSGVAKMESGLYDEAERYFKQALLHVEKSPISLARSVVSGTTSEAVAESEGSGSNNVNNVAQQFYDEGLCVYNEALSLSNAFENHEVLTFARVAYNIGQTYVRRCKFHAAKSWFDVAKSKLASPSQNGGQHCLLPQPPPPQHPHNRGDEPALTKLRILHNIGYCLYRLGKKVEAKFMYQKATALAQSEHLGQLHVAASKHAVAVLLYHLQDEASPSRVLYVQASRLFKESLDFHQVEFGVESKEVATILNNVGRLHFKNNDYARALSAYRSALRIRRKTLEADSLDIAATVCNLGQVLHKTGPLSEAHQFYQEFLMLIENRDDSNRDAAVILKHVGDLHHEGGKLQDALAMYKKSLEAFVRVDDSSQREQTILLNKLGTVCFELNSFQEALDYFNAGLSIELTLFDVHHPHILISLLNIAQIQRRLGDYASAIGKYYQVHAIQIETHGRNSLQAAATLSSLGQLKYLQQNFGAALELFQEALQIQRIHLGETESLDIACTLSSIGLVLFNTGLHEQSKACFSESLRIRQNMLGRDHLDTAIHLYNLATVYWESGDEECAIRLYKETLRIERLNGNHGDVILTLQYLGIVHQKRGELDKALDCFMEALRNEREHGSEPNGSAVAKLLNLIGNLHLQTGNVWGMMECYVEASRIYCALGSVDENLVIAGFYFYFFNKLHPPSAAAA